MSNEYLDSFNGFGKSAIDATKELVEINSKLLSRMLENQISLANTFVESSEKQVAKAGKNADPKDFIASQTALFEEYSAKLAEAAQANAKLAQDASEELKVWFEKGVKTADEAVKDAAKSAAAASPIKTAATVKAPAKKAAPKKAAPKTAAPKKAAAKPKAAPVSAKKPVTPKAPAATKKPAAKPAAKKAPAKTAAKPAAKKAPAKTDS